MQYDTHARHMIIRNTDPTTIIKGAIAKSVSVQGSCLKFNYP